MGAYQPDKFKQHSHAIDFIVLNWVSIATLGDTFTCGIRL